MLSAKEQEINLGKLRLGVAKSFKFELINVGSSNIIINRLELGCFACTTASIEKSALVPREKVFVDVIFTPGSTGINSKSVTVVYDNVKELKLKFKASVD